MTMSLDFVAALELQSARVLKFPFQKKVSSISCGVAD